MKYLAEQNWSWGLDELKQGIADLKSRIERGRVAKVFFYILLALTALAAIAAMVLGIVILCKMRRNRYEEEAWDWDEFEDDDDCCCEACAPEAEPAQE